MTEEQALIDYRKGLLTFKQLTSIIYRLDRKSLIEERFTVKRP